MDHEHERGRQRRSYRFCWVGFSVIALTLIVGAACSIGSLLLVFSGRPRTLGSFLGIPTFEFLVETFRCWTRIVGSLFLWSAWSEPNWRRRAGLLVLMSLIDVVLWGLEHGVPLGLMAQPVPHELFRHSLSMTLGWAKFILFASLASDFAQHVGVVQARDFGKAAQATAASGSIVWFVYFLNTVDWGFTWPLVQRPFTRDMVLLMLTYWVIAAICLVQTGLLSMLAGSSAARALLEMKKEDQSFDPWALPASDRGRVAAGR